MLSGDRLKLRNESTDTPALQVIQNPGTDENDAIDVNAYNLGTALRVHSRSGRTAFFKSESELAHTMTIYQAGTAGTDVAAALNVVSDNPLSSAMYLSGAENGRGTLKITHRNQSGSASGDANAAALSIDLKQDGEGGTAAKGIFITSTDGGTTGDLIVARNGGSDLFKVSSLGDVFAAGSIGGLMTPASHNLSAWSYDPTMAVNTTVVTNGTVYLVKVVPSATVSITKIYYHVGNVSVSPSAGQNEVGIYNASGTRLASVNVDADITSNGVKSATISSQTLTAGQTYWIGMVFNAGTAPGIGRTSGIAGAGSLINVGLSASAYRYATNGTSQTTLPSSITPGSNLQGIPLWAGVGV